MANVNSETILITGVTGYIGFKTLTTALEKGYRVRAVVRNRRNKSELLSKSPIIANSLDQKQLELVIVPDFLQENAVFDVLTGVTAIIHLASPLAVESNDHDSAIIKPAIYMVTTVLEAAARVPTIRRVVMTSSCVTLIPFEWNMRPDSERLYTVDDTNSNIPVQFGSAMEAYWASKALARNAVKEYISQHKPLFDFVNLLPSVVIGPDDRLLVEDAGTSDDLLQGTRAAVLAPALTPTLNSTFPYVGVPVHVTDVARAHVDAVDGSLVPGNSEYILCSDTPEGVEWDRDIGHIARKYFPAEVDSQVLPLKGSLTTIKWRLDAQATEKVFRWRFTSFEETMRQLISQYLVLEGR